MSDDFTWQPDPATRRLKVRQAVVLAFAALAVIAGSLYPIKLVVTAFERASSPRISPKGHAALSPVQEASRTIVSPTAHEAHATSSEPKEAPSETGRRMVVLNPGTAEPPLNEPPAKALSVQRGLGESTIRRQPQSASIKPGERNVLVVIRRRGPPYDTKVLRGKIRDGQLIVNARDRRGIALR